MTRRYRVRPAVLARTIKRFLTGCLPASVAISAHFQRLVPAAGFGPNTLLSYDILGEWLPKVRGAAIRRLVEMVREGDVPPGDQ